jgi:hypothetical protein
MSADQISPELRYLLLECFGKDHYCESFPQVFASSHFAEAFEIRHQGKLAAFAASIPFHWTQNGKRIVGHCVGSVCSHPEFRKQGFAQRALTLAEIHARNMGADFVFLFSDLDAFYRKAGYCPFGAEHFASLSHHPQATRVSQENLRRLVALANPTSADAAAPYWECSTEQLDELPNGGLAALWRLLERQRHPSENLLSFSDFRSLMTIPEVTAHVLGQPIDPKAVFFVGKGADFENVAHSLAAPSKSLVAILFQHFFHKHSTSQLLFMLPPSWRNLSEELATVSTPAFYAKPLGGAGLDVKQMSSLLETNKLYPRTFQSI